MAAPFPQCFPTGSVVWSNCPALNIGCYLYVDDEGTTPMPAGTYADAFTCVTTDSNGLIVSMGDCPKFYVVDRFYDCTTASSTIITEWATFFNDPTFVPVTGRYYRDAYDGCAVFRIAPNQSITPTNNSYYTLLTSPSFFNPEGVCDCGGPPPVPQ